MKLEESLTGPLAAAARLKCEMAERSVRSDSARLVVPAVLTRWGGGGSRSGRQSRGSVGAGIGQGEGGARFGRRSGNRGGGERCEWGLAKAVAKAATTVRMVTCRISDTRPKDDMLVTSCLRSC